MTLLDAYALVAFVADEPAAEQVDALLREGDARVVVVNLAEAVDIASRVHGITTAETRAALAPLLLADALAIVRSDEEHAWAAADVRAAHYDRKSCPISMADSFLLAHSLRDGGPIATADPPLADVARAERLDLVALPDSAGRLP